MTATSMHVSTYADCNAGKQPCMAWQQMLRQPSCCNDPSLGRLSFSHSTCNCSDTHAAASGVFTVVPLLPLLLLLLACSLSRRHASDCVLVTPVLAAHTFV